MISSYHPQTDGQSEAVNKSLERYLRCFTFENPKAWFKAFIWAEFWYNSSFDTSIAMTPFKALYGRDPPMLIRYVPSGHDNTELHQQLIERDILLQQLKLNLQKAQQRMKAHTDKTRTDVSFEIGEKVLVRLQPYRQGSAALTKNQKLGMRYFGPFPIIAKVGMVAYKLESPESVRIHPVFNISQLKPLKGFIADTYLPLPLTTTEQGRVLAPESTMQHCTLMKSAQLIKQVMVI